MRRVIIESPYAGDVERNLRYLRACMRDCLLRGEAPFASHGLYTQPGVLDDDIPAERHRGITAGFAWRAVADCTVVYDDLGVTGGMQTGIDHATAASRPIAYRRLGDGWDRAHAEHDFEGDEVDCAVCGEGRRHYLHSPPPYGAEP